MVEEIGVDERMPCEFFLIRYVPDVVKGEFVNIGVMLRQAGTVAPGGASAGLVRFTRNWSRVRCLDADADVELLEGLEAEFAARLNVADSARGPKRVLEVLEDSLSNSVQMTEPRACLAENLTVELEQLMRMYVEPIRVARVQKKTGRAAISGTMRMEFERAGVWGLMRKRIAAAAYTRTGDPMKLDCGYKAALEKAATIRVFHAVSLDADVEAAKVLAFSAPRLRDGVRRVEAAGLELTAVVEPLRDVTDTLDGAEDEAQERYRFGVETMEREAIRVVTMNDLARVAATARMELGL